MLEQETKAEKARELGWVWQGALGVFVVAAATGAFYRLGLAYGFTAGLELVNVRHAHSHLMYFAWATPVIMALIARSISGVGDVRRSMRWILGGCFGAAAVSYPLFLSFGYSLVQIGDARLPISVVGSTLNMVFWVWFVVWYVRVTKGRARDHAMLLWDAAVAFLVLAMSGAAGVSLLKPLGIESDMWSTALTHVFLDFFSEGWFVLGTLGLAHHALRIRRLRGGHWSIYPLCLGLPLMFALGMPSMLVPYGLSLVARAGGILVGIGLLANVWLLWRATGGSTAWLWRVPLLLLALKAAAQLIGGLVPGIWFADLHGIRILYLHLMLLGFVSLGLFAAAEATWGRAVTRGRSAFYVAVCGVLATLVPLSPLWPSVLAGRWAYVLAAWTSLVPVIIATIILLRSRRQPRAGEAEAFPSPARELQSA